MADNFDISFGSKETSIESNEQRFDMDLDQDRSNIIFDNIEEHLDLGGEKMYAHFEQAYKVGGNGDTGVTDYTLLSNKPKIEGNTLVGDKTFIELGLGEITPQDIDKIMFGGE